MTNANPLEIGMRIGLSMRAAEDLLAIVRKQGLDLQIDASGNSLIVYDMATRSVPNEQFTGIQPHELSSQFLLMRNVAGGVVLHPTNTPATWVFKTREFHIGVRKVVASQWPAQVARA